MIKSRNFKIPWHLSFYSTPFKVPVIRQWGHFTKGTYAYHLLEGSYLNVELNDYFKIPFLMVKTTKLLLLCVSVKGLGLIPGVVGRFDSSNGFRVPHIGWNALEISEDSEILDEISNRHVYFVHSYRAMPVRYCLVWNNFFLHDLWFSFSLNNLYMGKGNVILFSYCSQTRTRIGSLLLAAMVTGL